MASTMKPNHTSRRRRFPWRIALLPVILLLAIAAFVVESRSGWADLYRAAGISLDGPDAALLAQSPTTVTVLDIGQGDAVLLGQDGEYCLIDTGPSDAKDDLVRDLQLAGIAKLDYLVLTHPHADHTGGAKEVLRNFSVGQLLIPPWDAEASGETADWPRGLFELAEQQGTAVTVAEDGAVYSLGSGTLTILQGGESELYSTDDSSAHVNNASLCTMFEAGSFRYLSTGDAEAQAEQRKRARITLMEAETDIAEMISEMGEIYSENDAALRLRAMHLLYESVRETGGTVVVPSSFSEGFGDVLGDAAKDAIKGKGAR